jgi:hypothetical protein
MGIKLALARRNEAVELLQILEAPQKEGAAPSLVARLAERRLSMVAGSTKLCEGLATVTDLEHMLEALTNEVRSGSNS